MTKIILIALTLVSLSACNSLPVYQKGYIGSASKPILQQPTKQHAQYFGGTIQDAAASNKGEENLIADIEYQYNATFDYTSVSLHTTAYMGAHEIQELKQSQGNVYNYYGVAPQVSVSSFLPLGGLRVGITSWVGFNYEFGPYEQWMRAASELDLIQLADVDGTTYGVGAIADIISELGHIISVQAKIGMPGVMSISTHLQGEKYVFGFGAVPHLYDDQVGYYFTYKHRF